MEQIFYEDRALMFTDRTDPDMPGAQHLMFEGIDSAVEFALNGFRELSHNALVCINCGRESASEVFTRFCHKIGVIEAGGGLVRALDPQTGTYRYLYIYRNKTWDLPKGKREKGEKSEQNALREVGEETGLTGLQSVRFIRNTYHFIGGNPLAPPPNNGPIYVKQTSWFEMEAPGLIEPKPQLEEGIERCEWLSPEQIRDYLPSMYSSIAFLSNEYFDW